MKMASEVLVAGSEGTLHRTFDMKRYARGHYVRPGRAEATHRPGQLSTQSCNLARRSAHNALRRTAI